MCEKSDGIRAFLYSFIRNEKVVSFFVDRTNTLYYVRMTLNISKDTILDGELYYDYYKDKKQVTFAVFDCLIADGTVCVGENLVSRLNHGRKIISEMRCGFKIIVKQMYKSYGFCEVFKSIPSMRHKNDGMIFTPVNEPYRLGRCDVLLKWKPSHLNTVDFLMRKVEDCNYVYELLCYCKGNVLDVFDYYVDVDEDVIGYYDGFIGEFSFDDRLETYDTVDYAEIVGGWKLHRIRTDKNTPNSCKVIVNVINSIKENISYMDLESHFLDIKNSYKRRELIALEKQV